ncbi:hypothetical protein BH11MYX2_BH11MYX2_34470 [soil metagenome]
MSMFSEVEAFLGRAYPGSRLLNASPFLEVEAPHYRKLVSGKEQAAANDLLRESCWLVTVGVDPKPWLPSTDAVEQRPAYREIDYGKDEPAVQWVAKVRGRVDLEAIRTNAGLALTLLIAPASERMIDQAHLSYFASSKADLARAVAAHPESFQPVDVR